jgi:hypothetical protein
MLRRVADALHARIRIVFEPTRSQTGKSVAESRTRYGAKQVTAKRK